MLRSSRSACTSFTRFGCIVLSYVLLVTVLAPLTRSGVIGAMPRATSPAASLANQSGGSGGHRSGEALVRFRPEVSEGEKNALAAARGARRGRHLRGASRFERLELTGGQTPQMLAQQLADQPSVEWVEPNYLISRDDITPNDARFNEQWALRNSSSSGGGGNEGGQPGADIAAPLAWERTTGSTGTVIAVIDSGIDFTHPDLTRNQWRNGAERANNRDDDRDGYTDDLHGWDWVAGGNSIRDEQGHGTSVAGIIAAEGNNRVGTTGVMWRASLMSLRVLDATGTGEVADAVEAIDYAVAHGAQVINLSWGLETQSLALRDAIERASFRGVVVVCSAGNGGRNLDGQPHYPASYDLPNLIAVAATDSADNLTSWSNWGTARVTVAAPGVALLTTKPGGDYHAVTGTSAAAPLVSGIAGLIRTLYPGLNAADTRARIMTGTRQAAGLNGKVTAGGVAQAAAALSRAGGLGTGGGGHGNRNNGNGNDHGNNGNGNGGNNNGGGSGGWHSRSPRPGRPERGSGGRGPDGSFNVTPPEATRDRPGQNLPNLDEVRKLKSHAPQPPAASPVISANLLCADCDAGTGGGYVPPGDALYARARTEPRNETGQAGVDLGSQNFNWSTSLLGLPGRAGLDLGLSLSYNSLVWAKQDHGIKFNADRGFPGPGFRLGFPAIQPRYYNSQAGVYAYMMVTPAGGRVEMRQVGSSSVYEAQDSSYTQMSDHGGGTAVVRTTDGTQLSFSTFNGEMRCHQIKDRNGNYLTITYDALGHPATVVDTLGRVIHFNYDGNGNLTSLTQLWNGAWHTWASFTYDSVYLQGNFPGLSVNAPNNSYITVLKKVRQHDDSRFEFNYTSWGQVNRITKYAADGHQLNYTHYNLPANSGGGQSDCPRFTERRDWAENWNNGAEVVTAYAVAGDGSWSQVTTPDGTLHKEFFATTGWQRGLTTLSEVWSGGARKKWTTIDWTQDDINVPDQKNPRPAEINIHDAENNRKRTTISYTSYGLPENVREWGGGNGDQLLRRTHTYYNLHADFINRRLIGLPGARLVYEGESALVAKTEFFYDWGGEWFSAQAPSVQHDGGAYHAGFIHGRGNLSAVRRFNRDAPDDTEQAVWQQLYGYNAAGSQVFARDAAWHTTNISYADSYSDGNHNSRNTLAYPTMVTDPDGYSSMTQYNYDLGAVTRTQGPPPAGQTQGVIQTMGYDGVGRIERVTTVNNGAYTRWVYPAYQNYVLSYATVQEGAGEALSGVWFDGAGRMLHNLSALPNSAGGYALDWKLYDAMGRVKHQVKPTEINANWAPAGDDAAAGWVFTHQQYDWQGRPTLTTLPDGATTEAAYGGCGCAGGEVTTTRDERGRRKRYTKDALGRLAKVEELNWDQSVYATTTYSYNGRDQVTGINGAGQVRSLQYDGHGRLAGRWTPEQGQTSYGYYQDDTLNWEWDERGVTRSYSYNQRHLVTNINYSVPTNSTVTATSNVSYNYDAAGNRTWMSNGAELRQYAYDELSRLTHEDIHFPGLNANWHRLSYGYNLAGQLTRFTNPWNAQVAYTHDAEGRVTDVKGTDVNGVATYQGIQNYATNLKYRAFGALKEMTYGNSHPEWGAGGERKLTQNYDGRMRLTGWHVSYVMGWNYGYQHFGENSQRVTYAQSSTDPTLSRSYQYDHVGRLQYAHSGSEARMHISGQPNDGGEYGPYSQQTSYDVWGNVTGRVGWGGNYGSYTNQTASYTNNRRDGLTHDAAGNLTSDGAQYTYDATGQQTSGVYPAGWGGYANYTLQQGYNGDRLRVKKLDNSTATYYLRSSVLGGQVVAEMDWQGTWQRGYVYLGGQLLVLQSEGVPKWVHQDPVTKSQRLTDYNQNVVAVVDLDPWGGETSRSWGQGQQPQKFTTYERDGSGNDQAMFRQYHSYWQRFDQPDPYEGSYNLADPQSFNRYAYVQNDPVNFTDPTGLIELVVQPDYSGLLRLIFGQWGIDRVLELPVGNEGGGEGVTVEPPNTGQTPTPTPQTPLHCQPDVIEAMKRAWARTGNGTRGTETGFVLNGTPSNYKIVDTKSANTQSEQKMTVYGDTFLLFHVHPNSSTRNPSTPENNARGDRNSGDTLVSDRFQQRGRTIPFLVGHRNGLTMYDPKTKQVTVLRENLDWTKPCK